MEIFNKLNDKNIAPYLAKTIIIKNSEGNIVGQIPVNNYKPEYGKRLYRFAVLSDVHVNERDDTKDAITNLTPAEDAYADFNRALEFINTKPEKDLDDIQFACICGDLGSDLGGDYLSRQELINFYKNRKNISKPLYFCTGNHDCNKHFDFDDATLWEHNKTWGVATGLIDFQGEITPEALLKMDSCSLTGNYFTKIYTNSSGQEVKDNFYFLSMRKFSLGTQGEPFIDSDINALEEYLEEHKNERTFIFTHLPFPMRAGLFTYKYNTGNYWLGGKYLKRLSDLSYKYKNTLWFSGHSHYEWNCQGITKETMTMNNALVYNWKEANYDANVWPANQDHERECGWALHIPSCSGVRPIEYSTNNGPWKVQNTSEFAIVDVYENYIDFRGVSLIGQNEGKEKLYYNPIALYRLDTTPKNSLSYSLKLLTVEDLLNIETSKTVCITSIAFDNYHLGSVGNEFKNAAFYNSFGNNSEAVRGADINSEEHKNSEDLLFAEMRDLVNMRPKQFTFELIKYNNRFQLKNQDGKYLSVNSDNLLTWEDSPENFEILGASSRIASSSLVALTNNPSICRFKKDDRYIKLSENPNLTSEEGSGWSSMYIYEIVRE